MSSEREKYLQAISSYDEPNVGERLIQKAKNSPALVIGLTSLVTICGYGAYKFKTTTLPTSLYLLHLRVIAQGAFIGSLTVGMIYHMVKDIYPSDKKEE